MAKRFRRPILSVQEARGLKTSLQRAKTSKPKQVQKKIKRRVIPLAFDSPRNILRRIGGGIGSIIRKRRITKTERLKAKLRKGVIKPLKLKKGFVKGIKKPKLVGATPFPKRPTDREKALLDFARKKIKEKRGRGVFKPIVKAKKKRLVPRAKLFDVDSVIRRLPS